MKSILVLILILFCLNVVGQKTVTTNKEGNYISTSTKKTTTNKPTGKYFIDSNKVKYLVYVSSNGKLFYYKTSKKGNTYKVYITNK